MRDPVTPRGTALLSTIPSDSHSWNLVYIELLLREHGFSVVPLGVAVPVEATVEACLTHRPSLVVISTVNGHGHLEGPEISQRVRQLPIEPAPLLVIGGKLATLPEQERRHAAVLRRFHFDAVYCGPRAAEDFTLELPSLLRSRSAGPPGGVRGHLSRRGST